MPSEGGETIYKMLGFQRLHVLIEVDHFAFIPLYHPDS
jgi:hypothetical protein